ncbi:hypothetical protein AB0910_05930 [Streptomyces sp. NPDC047002]|uniref:hypothetical protein n=1 Tax=Streptomyces sp. NPDC047002 TaxID=3155475 RepID=UPI003456ED2B
MAALLVDFETLPAARRNTMWLCLLHPQTCEPVLREGARINGRGRKAIRPPDAGALSVHFEVLMPLQDTDQRLVICRPAALQTGARI